MSEPLNIHFTEAQELLRCTRKWYDSNYLQLEPLEKTGAMSFGSAFHKMKQTYLEGNEVGLPDESLYQSDVELLFKLFHVWKTWHYDQPYTYLQIEQPLTIEYEPGVMFTVTPDALLRDDSTGELWIDETKTVGSFDEDRLHLDLQGRVQMTIAKQLGHDVAGVKYTQVRKSNPDTARVEILKEFEVRFPDGALRDAAQTMAYAMRNIITLRAGLDEGWLDKERVLIRNSNPIGFMDCACWFSKACIASFMGREQEALDTLYKVREPR